VELKIDQEEADKLRTADKIVEQLDRAEKNFDLMEEDARRAGYRSRAAARRTGKAKSVIAQMRKLNKRLRELEEQGVNQAFSIDCRRARCIP
jgi:hypothetical protein